MNLPQLDEVTTAEQARDLAIEWQNWAGGQPLSYGEMAEYQAYFETLAKRYRIIEELKENGIL